MLQNRNTTIDLIRGVVILMILFININYISVPTILRYNPSAFGEYTVIDQWVWFFEYTFVKQRFMPLLALLFGAGIWLFCQKYEQISGNPTKAFFKRIIILITFGLIHAYFIWDGDILVAYALCGLFAYSLRNLPVKWLFIIGIMFTIGPVLTEISSVINKLGHQIDTPAFWLPTSEYISESLKAYDNSWLSLTPARIEVALSRQTSAFINFTFWRCTGLMLIGIALVRTDFFEKKNKIRSMGVISFIIGFPVSVLGSYFYIQGGYQFDYFSTYLTLSFHLGTLSLAFAYLCLLSLWGQSSFALAFQKRLHQVGQYALSLYIGQSIICTFIFYGWGLGLYGKLSRADIFLLTIVIITFQLVLLRLWAIRFSSGPLEMLWRKAYTHRLNKTK